MTKATILIMDTLRAMGAAPTVTTDDAGNDVIKINAPEPVAGGNCDKCARRDTCKKSFGHMFGYCNTDFIPGEGAQKWPD